MARGSVQVNSCGSLKMLRGSFRKAHGGSDRVYVLVWDVRCAFVARFVCVVVRGEGGTICGERCKGVRNGVTFPAWR